MRVSMELQFRVSGLQFQRARWRRSSCCPGRHAGQKATTNEELETRHWKPETASPLFDRNFTQQFEVAEHFARAQNYAAQRIIGNRNRQPGFFPNTFVEILQQRSTAGQHDAAVAD